MSTERSNSRLSILSDAGGLTIRNPARRSTVALVFLGVVLLLALYNLLGGPLDLLGITVLAVTFILGFRFGAWQLWGYEELRIDTTTVRRTSGSPPVRRKEAYRRGVISDVERAVPDGGEYGSGLPSFRPALRFKIDGQQVEFGIQLDGSEIERSIEAIRAASAGGSKK